MFKIGVAGCGRIASSFDDDPKRKYTSTHIGAYRRLRNTNVVAVCDINKERLEKCLEKWGISRGYLSLKEMIGKEKIDILSICTPPDTHYAILKQALEFPLKAIFCEKPLADNLKDAEKMVMLCKQKKIILQVDHQRRFDPLHENLKNFIKRKKLGDVQQVNFYYTAGIKNTGSHMFDLLRFFFGDVEWIEAMFSKNKSNKEKDPNLDGILKFRDGLFGTFQACDAKKYLIFELNCFLNKGRFILKNSGFSVDFYEVRDSLYFSGYKELYKNKTPFNMLYRREFMVNAVKHLLECIQNNKESISSGGDGFKALELVEAGIISANSNGKRIYLD